MGALLDRIRGLDVGDLPGKRLPAAPPRRGGDFGPSVDPETRRVRYLSASQLEKIDHETYGGCRRRWWFRYVAKASEPQFASQKLGEQVHSQIERYLKTGDDVLGDLARAGRRFIPAPGEDLSVEAPFGQVFDGDVISPLDAAGVPLVGFVDLAHRRETWLDDDGAVNQDPAGTLEVVDWKTTARIEDQVDALGNVKKGLAKTPDQVAASWQMEAYAELYRRLYQLDYVRVSHGYFQTKGPRAAKKVSARLSADLIEYRWERAGALAESAKVDALARRPEDVPVNLASCSAYGGCPHKASCPREAKDVLAQLFAPTSRAAAMTRDVGDVFRKIVDRDLIARTLLGAVFAAGESPPAVLGTEDAGVAIAMNWEPALARAKGEDDMSLKERLAARAAAAAKPEEKAAEKPPEAARPAATRAEVDAEIARLEAEESVRAPDAPAPKDPAQPPEAGERAPASALAPGQCARSKTLVELSVEEAADRRHHCVCGEDVKVKPQKLADGKWRALVGAHGGEEVKSPEKTRPLSEEVRGATAAFVAGPLRLFLDCRADGSRAERLEVVAEALCRQLEAEFRAADVRCAPEGSPLAFGKWRGALAALARDQRPAGGDWECSSKSELGMVVFEALAPGASLVVRG